MGRLTPVLVQECVPSDYFRGSSEILVRLAPLLAPIYDMIELYVHFFFVPNRLLWEDWEEFITGGRLGVGVDPLTAPVPPYIDLGQIYGVADWAIFAKSTLGDYLGLPDFLQFDPDTPETTYLQAKIDVMPFLVYKLIWEEYYRDRNFVEDSEDSGLALPLPSGLVQPDDFENYFSQLRTRNYAHDYFNSALPFTQRGTEVLMPLAGTGSVTYVASSTIRQSGGAVAPNINPLRTNAGSLLSDGTNQLRVENIDDVILDASSVSINDFRSAYALQVWLERNAIGGSRYVESTQAHFGVKPQDSRLQRPEYIGGGRIPIKISEVVSTAYSNDGSDVVPLANMGGHGITYGNTNQFEYFCTEHGFIMGIASIMVRSSYHQGVPRMFVRRSFLDYPWPTFAKLGEQQVNAFELFASPANLIADADGVFELWGYQSRYADWKYVCNTNHGDFHDTLLFWSVGTRDFDPVAAAPVLSETFNEFEDASQDRIFAVNGGADNFWLYVHNKVSVKRPLPYFGTPNNLGFS